MRLNLLLVSAAIVYGLSSLALIFAPTEVLGAANAPSGPVVAWMGQLLGGALFGLAMLNWMQRYSVVGGILGRPILVTNLSFLAVSFFASLSSWRHTKGHVFLIASAVLGSLFVAFGSRLSSRATTVERGNREA